MGDDGSERPERQYQSLKIVALILPVLTLCFCWSLLFAARPGVLTYAAINLLRQIIGYFAYLLPIFLFVIGQRLLITLFWKPYPVRRYALGLVGGVILFISLLPFVHGWLIATQPQGPLLVNPELQIDPDPLRMWNESVPVCDANSPTITDLEEQGWVKTWAPYDSMQLARCGAGGGLIGAVIYGGVYSLVGGLPIFMLSMIGTLAGLVLWLYSIIDQLRWKPAKML